MYTSTEAAELLGVTRQTVARYVRAGLLDAHLLGLRHSIRISEDALQRFVTEQGITLLREQLTILKQA